MELSNSFEVERPIDEAWEVLTDVERIAPCLPGAKLEEVDGDEYRGIVKVKVGPITAQYKGTATFVERDDQAHRAVLKADGRDTRGAGNASALITASAEALSPTTTKVDVETDMTVTGKVAQFGRGVMADVSAKLMGQFADNLGEMLASDSGSPDASAGPEPASATGSSPGPQASDGTPASAAPPPGDRSPVAEAADDVEAVDLIGLAGVPVLKRLIPLVVLVVLVVVVLVLVL